MFKRQFWPLLPHLRYWRFLWFWHSSWFWRNLIIRNLCSANLPHQNTRRLGGIVYLRYLGRWHWRVKRSTLMLSTTSRRLCSVFLCLECTTLLFPTTFLLTFGCSGSFFYDLFCSYFHKVLIIHDFRFL
jgi:hypothetical protein